MMPDDLSHLEGDAPEPTGDQLTRLRDAGERLWSKDAEVADTEAKLKRLKQERRDIAEGEIPNLLDNAGVDRIGLSDKDCDIVVAPYYSASLPKDAELREEALVWLTENEHGDIIKVSVHVDFGRQERELAQSLANAIVGILRTQGLDKAVGLDEGVHHSTLTAFVREQLEAGAAVPLHLFQAQVGRIAVIKKRS